MPKYLVVPPSITLKNLITNEPGDTVAFRDFVVNDILAHPVWGFSIENTRCALEFVTALDEAKDSLVRLSDNVWQRVIDCLSHPQYRTFVNGQEQFLGGYRRWSGASLLQLLPFSDAFFSASSKAPEVKDATQTAQA